MPVRTVKTKQKKQLPYRSKAWQAYARSRLGYELADLIGTHRSRPGFMRTLAGVKTGRISGAVLATSNVPQQARPPLIPYSRHIHTYKDPEP